MKLSYEKNRIAFSNIFPIIGKLRINSEKKFYKSQAQAKAYFYLLLKDKSRVGLFKSQPANGNIKLNLKKLRESNPNWIGSTDVTLILKPINNSGDTLLEGNEYEIKTLLTFPAFQIDEDIINVVPTEDAFSSVTVPIRDARFAAVCVAVEPVKK